MKWLMAIPVWSTPRDSLNRFNLVFSRCPYEESPLRSLFYVLLGGAPPRRRKMLRLRARGESFTPLRGYTSSVTASPCHLSPCGSVGPRI